MERRPGYYVKDVKTSRSSCSFRHDRRTKYIGYLLSHQIKGRKAYKQVHFETYNFQCRET